MAQYVVMVAACWPIQLSQYIVENDVCFHSESSNYVWRPGLTRSHVAYSGLPAESLASSDGRGPEKERLRREEERSGGGMRYGGHFVHHIRGINAPTSNQIKLNIFDNTNKSKINKYLLQRENMIMIVYF